MQLVCKLSFPNGSYGNGVCRALWALLAKFFIHFLFPNYNQGYEKYLVALKSTQHRPADVLSNTLSQAQSSRCSKVKNLRKNRNWIRKWKKAVSILGDWTFFSPDWRRSFHSPYILKGKSVFCDWLECLPFYIVPYSMYGPVHRGVFWKYFVQLWINLFEKNNKLWK